MRGLMRFEKAVERGLRFIGDVHFFWWELRYSFRQAVTKARDTIY